jgi:hypothetical protein
VKERFGSRSKMVDDLLKMQGREKDEGLRARYEKWGLPRLWDHYKGVARRGEAARQGKPVRKRKPVRKKKH